MSDLERGDTDRQYDGSEPQEVEKSKRTSRFRFKDKSVEPSRGRSSRSASPAASSSHGHRRHRRRHHHGRHRVRRESPNRSPVPDSDTAFRLSLFDALADDEGADFWQGVYGQPIHSYSDTKITPEGELERMTDEEYTAYVRRRMWEKSREGIEAEREARAQEKRERQKAEEAGERDRRIPSDPGHERNVFDVDLEESLRRGEKRKRDKVWKGRWEDYLQAWDDLNALAASLKTTSTSEHDDSEKGSRLYLRNKIEWPVETNKRKDVTPEEVERFFRKTTSAAALSSDTEDDPRIALMTALKLERIRWHPDKIQHRFAKLEIDEGTMKAVTSVFQIVDRMWNEERGQGMI